MNKTPVKKSVVMLIDNNGKTTSFNNLKDVKKFFNVQFYEKYEQFKDTLTNENKFLKWVNTETGYETLKVSYIKY
jgi:hypothetical protein